VARPGSDALPVNGEQVRNTRVLLAPYDGIAGYDARQVDDLLLRVAAELDAGRPAGPLIENATFRKRTYRRRYDIDAVDWFLGQLLLPPGHVELAEISADPWHDLAVTQLATGEVSGLAERHRHGRARRHQGGEYFVEQCENAWRDFGQLRGTHLRWEKVGRALSELRTADQQTLASARDGWSKTTVSAGGRSFAFKAVSAGGIRINYQDGTAQPAPPGADEFSARVSRDAFGHFTITLEGRTQPCRSNVKVEELADETGMPALYTCGQNFNFRAHSSIMFPGHRQLRFLVRGTGRSNAIMTAVDQIGKSVARYRIIDKKTTEIAVNPGWKLTDELTLAIAVSAPWLDSYFQRPSVG
jgi:hypothetical protein